MRYLTCAALTATACLVFAAVTDAEPSDQPFSASSLGASCASVGSDSKTCSAYIAGFTQGFYYASVSAQAGSPPCLPHGVSDAQARLIVTKFISAHPEMSQQGAASVIAEALIDAFPCAHS
jgi:hypothetical protein